MKLIILYGVLAKKFGKEIRIFLNKKNEILNAIDSIKAGFKKEINSLLKEGFNYSIVEKDNKIHIVPCITGTGPLLIVGLLFFAGFTAFALGATSLAITFLMYGMQYLMYASMKNIKFPQMYGAVGGFATNADARSSSYIFRNEINMATQGAIIPIGYGRMRSTSSILNFSRRSYPTNISESEEFNLLRNRNFLNIYD